MSYDPEYDGPDVPHPSDYIVSELKKAKAEIERLKTALRDALTAWQESRNLNEDQIRAALEGK